MFFFIPPDRIEGTNSFVDKAMSDEYSVGGDSG